MINTKQNTRNNQKKSRVEAKKNVKVPQTIKVGNSYTVKITALSSVNLGLNELTYGFPILIGGLQKANATLGDTVQIQILKIKKGLTSQKLAIAKVLKIVTKAKTNLLEVQKTAFEVLGKTVEVTILKNGPKGTYLAELPGNLKLVIASKKTSDGFLTLGKNQGVGTKVSVKVTRIKQNYAFATIAMGQKSTAVNKKASASTEVKYSPAADLQGSKFSLILPKKAKRYFKHIVIQVNYSGKGQSQNGMASYQQYASTNKLFGLSSSAALNAKKVPTILFIKPIAGAKLGDKVQIQIIKAFNSNTSKAPNILIGKIVLINPISSKNKKVIIQHSIKQMLTSGMHFGEKAVRCNARMKNYVWTVNTRKKGYSSLNAYGSSEQKNKPLIQKGRNIINLLKTRRCLTKALEQLTKYAAKGKTFLFVGTKKAASGLIARASLFSKKAFFVNTRWLGGMLTNWKTILKSISKIRPILKEKQVIIKDILQKRQSIKTMLMEKAFLLKKKSQFVLKKGRQLFQKLQTNNSGLTFGKTSAAQQLISKRKEFVQKGQILLEKRQLLLQKRKQLIVQSTALYQKAVVLINNSKEFLTKATLLRQKLRELKALLFVSQQLQTLQQSAKGNSNVLYTISYNQYKQLSNNLAYVIPNPPKEILNKMILLIKNNSLVGASPSEVDTRSRANKTSNISQKDAATVTSAGGGLILTKLLSQFSSFAPSIKLSIKVLLTSLQKIQGRVAKFQETLKLIVSKMQNFITIKNNIVSQLRQIQQSLTSQRNIIRIVKRKFKQILAQKRFIQFLPKLRYLPTPSTKISETVQVLMKKIVDPKLKYPIDSIYDQKLTSQSKKVAAMRKKKWQRLEKYLGGISNMTHMNPQQIRSNVAIIIGQQEEMNAVRECKKLGIKMFHIVDTNCNPGLADHFIPANDDSRNSIQLILTQFLTRIRLAQKLKKTVSRVG